MTLTDFIAALEQHPASLTRFVLPDQKFVPIHAHVTEVGHINKRFIDCGGQRGEADTVVLQTHVGQDIEHRLTTDRLLKILGLGNQVLPSPDLDVEVEYDCCVVSQYPVAAVKRTGHHLDVILRRKHTHCLAAERRKTAIAKAGCDTASCC